MHERLRGQLKLRLKDRLNLRKDYSEELSNKENPNMYFGGETKI